MVNLPPAASRILVALVAVQALRTVLPQRYDFLLVYLLAFDPFRGGTFDPGWLYGAFTSVFVHAGWLHLLMNGLWIAALSSQIQPHLRGMRYVAFFTIAGAAGALVHGGVNWGTPGLLVGASGAVFGLLGAGAHVLLRGSDGRSRPRASHYVQYVLIVMILNVGYAALGDGRISWEAHAGGFFAGLALFPLLRSPRPQAGR